MRPRSAALARWTLGVVAVCLLALRAVAYLPMGEVALAELPPEARQTIALIEQGGPFPYARDGITFHNREERLPARADGYYREYTVRTPGARGRGPRRIVRGRDGELYYTDDHYRRFRRVRE